MSIEPFNRLVRLAARAFYDDITMKGDNQPKTGRGDNRGMAVVVLDALTRRQWVREEDLAKALKLHSKQLRRTLRFFEEEKLVTRDHRKESAKGAKIYSAAVAATADQKITKEGEEKMKMHTHSYCCLDYAQIYDVVRYRIHRMKKKLKDELDDRNTVQEYVCPNCGRRFSAFDALQLVSPNDEYFHCENCNGELVAVSDKLAAEEMGDGDENARRRRQEKMKDMLQKIEDIFHFTDEHELSTRGMQNIQDRYAYPGRGCWVSTAGVFWKLVSKVPAITSSTLRASWHLKHASVFSLNPL